MTGGRCSRMNGSTPATSDLDLRKKTFQRRVVTQQTQRREEHDRPRGAVQIRHILKEGASLRCPSCLIFATPFLLCGQMRHNMAKRVLLPTVREGGSSVVAAPLQPGPCSKDAPRMRYQIGGHSRNKDAGYNTVIAPYPFDDLPRSSHPFLCSIRAPPAVLGLRRESSTPCFSPAPVKK